MVEFGLLISMVFYYFKSFEDYFGIVLFDYSCRLMVLMFKGYVFFCNIDDVLFVICKV